MSSPKRSSATTSHNCAATTAPLTSPDQIASIPTPGRRRAIRRSDRHALMPCRYDAGTLARSIPRVTTRMTRVYDAANTASHPSSFESADSSCFERARKENTVHVTASSDVRKPNLERLFARFRTLCACFRVQSNASCTSAGTLSSGSRKISTGFARAFEKPTPHGSHLRKQSSKRATAGRGKASPANAADATSWLPHLGQISGVSMSFPSPQRSRR